jgi:Iguana/Dzip1-like DAZ-interacting protein N-terminal
MVKFAFRQRVGKINWNVVSAVCIQDVVEHLKVNELQTVLDAITFCEFKPSDVKNCPIETVVQLVQIFQFTIEFLLHSQESQNVLIDRMHRKNTSLKDSNRHLSAQVASYKEDTKIYQRQLLVLRQSMNIREPQHPRVVDLKRKDSSDIQPIVASVLQSEKESREHLRVLLEDQRIAFMKELELSRLASITASAAASSAAAKSQMMRSEKLMMVTRICLTYLFNVQF